eukprot:m.20711 g.20711  ORF g.20711 m.20711 type:complete len:412 (-) comp5277_c0_seq1:232-1467(-)
MTSIILQRMASLTSRPAVLEKAITIPWTPILEEAVKLNASYQLNPLSLAKYVQFGEKQDRHLQLIQSCQFVKSEGLVRLSHMIQEMRTLPSRMLLQTDVQHVYNWYLDSFKDLYDAPDLCLNDSLQDVNEFTSVIRQILRRHEPTVMTMSMGFRKLEEEKKLRNELYITNYLDRFLMSRIGTRFLLNQHLGLVDSGKNMNASEMIGSIDKECNVKDIATSAAMAAKGLCESLYFCSPDFEIVCHGNSPVISHVPSHLYHIIFELMKNSFRAVAEFHDDAPVLPPIKIVIVHADKDLTIKISDEGGGIPFVDVPKLFSYFYTTASTPIVDETGISNMNNAPMAGFGFGLPVSRLYARYFGGDLRLISIDSYGTDAFVFLQTMAENATEVLPSFNPSELHYQTEKTHWMDLNV